MPPRCHACHNGRRRKEGECAVALQLMSGFRAPQQCLAAGCTYFLACPSSLQVRRQAHARRAASPRPLAGGRRDGPSNPFVPRTKCPGCRMRMTSSGRLPPLIWPPSLGSECSRGAATQLSCLLGTCPCTPSRTLLCITVDCKLQAAPSSARFRPLASQRARAAHSPPPADLAWGTEPGTDSRYCARYCTWYCAGTL